MVDIKKALIFISLHTIFAETNAETGCIRIKCSILKLGDKKLTISIMN